VLRHPVSLRKIANTEKAVISPHYSGYNNLN